MKIADELIPMFLIDVMEDGDPTPSAPGGTTISQNNLGQVLPTYFPKFIKKRKKLIEPYKDFRKSQDAKQGHHGSEYTYHNGMRQWVNSTAGKKFYRNLSTFLANREPGHMLNRYESSELASLLSSYRTHALLELNYYKPFSEEVDFFLAIEGVIKLIDKYTAQILEKVFKYDDFEITEDLYSTIFRIMEPAGVVHSLAVKTGKTDAEVEKLWDKAKEVVKDEYKAGEDEDRYWALVTGTLKKMLGIEEDDGGKVND